MNRYIISGVTSFLGSNLAKCLIADGNEVFGIVRPKSNNKRALESIKDLKSISLDLDSADDSDSLYEEIKECGISDIDGWIHFSWDGIGSEGRSDLALQERNIVNSKKAFGAAEKLGAKRFVFSGSQAEYGDGTKDKPNPKSQYGIAKLKFGTWASMQQSEMEFVHLRIYSVYGPGDHDSSLVNSSIIAFLGGKDMFYGPCTQQWNYMDIRDCSRAIAMIVEREKETSGVFEIASATSKKLASYVDDIWRICGEKGNYYLGQRGNNAEGAVDLKPDVSRLKELGFSECYSFEEGIRNILTSLREESND